MHQSYIFFLLDHGQIELVPSPDYVSIVRGHSAMPEYAGKKVRVADLYVALEDTRPCGIENETYSFLYFDAMGHADPHAGTTFPVEVNRCFYNAALNSPYPDIDCDPQVQKAREQIGDDFSWLPTQKERRSLNELVFGK